MILGLCVTISSNQIDHKKGARESMTRKKYGVIGLILGIIGLMLGILGLFT